MNAFVPGPRCNVAGAATGPLAGMGFAVKDLIDVAGVPTGGGNPDWRRIYPTPAEHAWVVQRLLHAGASVIGKTVTDEVSLGILGENAHDGTPLNPAAPDRVPGGSSSGSASAVASGACDFALGTDSGGSVRVPGQLLWPVSASARHMAGSTSPASPCSLPAPIHAAGLPAMRARSQKLARSCAAPICRPPCQPRCWSRPMRSASRTRMCSTRWHPWWTGWQR